MELIFILVTGRTEREIRESNNKAQIGSTKKANKTVYFTRKKKIRWLYTYLVLGKVLRYDMYTRILV